MQLPREFLDKINLKLSRHKHPDKLDWIKIRADILPGLKHLGFCC